MTRTVSSLISRSANTVAYLSGARAFSNYLQYGPDAPRPQTRLRIAPNQIVDRYLPGANNGVTIGHWRTGAIEPGDWDCARRPFNKSLKFKACRANFFKGVPWEETRAIPYGLKKIAEQGKYDNCRTLEDLLARYNNLHDLWIKTQALGHLPPHLDQYASARTGVLAHVDRNGALLFGNKGFHRLAIAKLTRIDHIWVVLGVVHPEALQNGSYQALLRDNR